MAAAALTPNMAQPGPRLFYEENGEPLSGTLAVLHRTLSAAPPPLRSQLQRVARRALASRLPALRAQYADGRSFSFAARDPMHASVFIFGEYEPAESGVIRLLLRAGDFAIDVGANIGWFSLLMATCAGETGLVWAIEPAPPIRRRLETNVRANPSLNVRVLPLAVGRSAGVAEIHLFDRLPHGHASLSALGRDDAAVFEVEVTPLDGLVQSVGRPPALVKVDVEGSELDVLGGAVDLLSSPAPPVWMLEVNYQTSRSFGYEPIALLDTLKSFHDYRVLRLSGGRIAPEDAPHAAPHGATWVCVPPQHEERGASIMRQ